MPAIQCLANVNNAFFWDLGSLMALLKGDNLLFAIISLSFVEIEVFTPGINKNVYFTNLLPEN